MPLKYEWVTMRMKWPGHMFFVVCLFVFVLLLVLLFFLAWRKIKLILRTIMFTYFIYFWNIIIICTLYFNDVFIISSSSSSSSSSIEKKSLKNVIWTGVYFAFFYFYMFIYVFVFLFFWHSPIYHFETCILSDLTFWNIKMSVYNII